MKRQRFTVTARGSLDISEPYEMVIVIDDAGITIDGKRVSWNDARAAIETARDIEKARKSLFGSRR